MPQITDPRTGATREFNLDIASSPAQPSISEADVALGKLQQLKPLPTHQEPDPVLQAQMRDAQQGVSARPKTARDASGRLTTTAALDAEYNRLQALQQGVGTLTEPLGLTDYAAQLQDFGEPDSPEKRQRAMARTLGGMEVAGLKALPIRGFYSRLEGLLDHVKGSEHPNRIRTLMHSVGSPEEAAERGFTSWLDSKGNTRVSKQEIADWFAANKMPAVQEIQLGFRRNSRATQLKEDIEALRHKDATQGLSRGEEDRLRELEDESDHLYGDDEQHAPKWDREDVNLPGGQNYREYVFTLPKREIENPVQPKQVEAIIENVRDGPDIGKRSDRIVMINPNHTSGFGVRIVERPDGSWTALNSSSIPPGPYATFEEALEKAKALGQQRLNSEADVANENASRRLNYTSGHWKDITNPLAHVRLDERATVHGEPALFIQEGQSDWHQQGRETGYRGAVSQKQKDAAIEADRLATAKMQSARGEFLRTLDRLGLKTDLPPVKEGFQLVNFAKNINAGRFGDLGSAMASWRSTTDDLLRERDWKIGERGSLGDINQLKLAASEYELRAAEAQNAAAAARALDHAGGVPDAPFKDTGWQKLVFNRALIDAVESDKQWLTWTTGDMQAERYGNLLQDVSGVAWSPERAEVIVWNSSGRHVFDDIAGEADLKKLLGDSATKRLLDSKPFDETKAIPVGGSDDLEWSGHGDPRYRGSETFYGSAGDHFINTRSQPLKITSAGMVQQYDKNWVDYANKLTKKYGTQVEKVKTPNHDPDVSVVMNRAHGLNGLYYVDVSGPSAIVDNVEYESRAFQTPDEAKAYLKEIKKKISAASAHEVWGLRLTPELKKAIKEKGLPLMGLGMAAMASHEQE